MASNTDHPIMWPPVFTWAISAALFYLTFRLWPIGQSGHDAAALGAAAAGVYAVVIGFKGLARWDAWRDYRRVMKTAVTPSKNHGQARFATKRDTKQAGMNKSGGFFLGALDGKDIYHHGEGSLWCYAPPGCGKTTCGVIPQLLFKHFDAEGRFVSIQVLDMTGELYAVTSRRMRQLGYDVVAVSPWANKMSRELGIEIHDCGYNPTLPLLNAGEETKDMAEMLAELLLPGQHTMSESAAYFLSFGRDINAWGLMVMAQYGDPDRMNLVALRRLLMSPPEKLEELLAQTSQCDAFGGALRQYANKLIQTKINSSEEWSGAINTATKALKIYDDLGPLGKHVSATDGFRFSRMKDKPTCAYIMMLPEMVTSHGSWLNLTLSTSIEQMGRDRTNKRVLCLYDEYANAGYTPNLLKSLGLYRKQGLIFSFYSQTSSQIRRLYGDDGLRDFMGMCDVVQAFGVRDPQTLRLLSELAGQNTIKEYSQNLNLPNHLTGDPNMRFSTGATNQGRSLIRPEDIRMMPDDKQLIFYKNLPPIMADKVSYLQRRSWLKYAAPNPYYRKG